MQAGIHLEVGKQVTGVQFTVTHGIGASTRTYALKKRTAAGTNSTVASGTDATSDSGNFQLSLGALTTTLVTDAVYWVEGILTETDDAIHFVEVFYTDP